MMESSERSGANVRMQPRASLPYFRTT